MLISYIMSAYPRGTHPFERRLPTIVELQRMIEEGWDKGVNSSGREETGGILGTRKYIGTPEAQTLFVSLAIPCKPHAFARSTDNNTQLNLLGFIESYFAASNPTTTTSSGSKIINTTKAPIYFQHSGHSMTIVGLEKYIDGTAGLLVFDPFFTPGEGMRQCLDRHGQVKKRVDPGLLLKLHRRGMDYLTKYREFEIIVLVSPTDLITETLLT